MKTLLYLMGGAILPGVAHAEMSEVLGPVSPVFKKTEDGTAFVKSGWFPDAQFPYVWGGANDPDTNLSWWMERRKGSMYLDYTEKAGDWIPKGPPNSPDDRGTWIQSVYRPVDVKPALAGTAVDLKIYDDHAEHGATPLVERHYIDADYLVGFAHTEDWDGVLNKVVNYSRTLYSFDNGKTWKKGPFAAMGLGVIDYRTDPANPRYVNRSRWTADIAKGVDDYHDNPSVFTDGNLYGTSGILWSRYLNRYLMMFGYNGAHGKTLNFTTTDHFTAYGAKTFVSIWKNDVPGRAVVAGAGDYPTLLGGFPEGGSYRVPFNMEIGQLGWVYNKSGGGLSGRAIHFISPDEQAVAWQGGDAAHSVSAVIVDSARAQALKSGIFVGNREVAALGDEDGDGIPNLIESVTGTRLDVPDAKPPGTISQQDDHTYFTYTRDAAKRDLCAVEWSESMADDWRTDGLTETVLATADGIETVRASLPKTASARCFMRLRAIGIPVKETLVTKGVAAGPADLGGGILLTVDETQIPASSGASANWTFTRSGATTAAQTMGFSIGGSAMIGTDYTVTGAATLSGRSGTVVIPAGETSVMLTTTMTGSSGIGRSLILSASQALQLASAVNWSQGTGAFTEMADEVHSLNFNSAAGGEFENDIPMSKRLRSITLGPSSGNHTINGNPFGIEASVKVAADKTTSFYGITQQSAATVTFNTDIHTRSAALYLRPEIAGGKIELNGTVDMLGTGGVVVSGAGDVVIHGDLIDSGYSDFASGQAEYVAGVNQGRLIMVGDGTLVLSGNNSFTGRADLNYGTTSVDSFGALQNSIVTLNKDLGLKPTVDFKVGGLNGGGNLNLGGHNLTMGNHNPPDCYPTNYTGIISGSGAITKIDGNVQKLGALNQHSGGTFLKGGILEVPPANNTAFGSGKLALDGGTLKVTGPLSLANDVWIGAAGGTLETGGRTITFNGPLTGSGNLVSSGGGTLVLSAEGTFTGTLTTSGSLVLSHGGALGAGVLMLGGKLAISTDQTLAGLTTVDDAAVLDTGAHTLTITGAIDVAAGRSLTKSGTGILEWSGNSSLFLGDLTIQGGTIHRAQSGDFTHGSVAMGGSGISLAPSGSGDEVVSLAHEEGTRLTLNGASSLALDKGGATSLVVNIGSSANPNALVLGDSSTALIAMGTGTKLFAEGQAATPAGEAFSPAVILTGADLTGNFSVYSLAEGFAPFQNYAARAGSFSVAAGGSEVTNITGNATLAANGSVKGLRIASSQSLAVTSRVLTFAGTGGKAGLLLNNGSVAGGTIAFGTNKAYIYTSGQDASISSAITGSGGLVFTGEPGTKVSLSSWSTSFSERLTVAGTTLVVPNTTVIGASGTPFTIDGGGTMSFPNTMGITRAITFGSGGACIDVAAGATFTNGGGFSGIGEFRKKGTGTVKWSTGGSSTGPVVVEAGLLDYAASSIQGSSGPITVAEGARVNLNSIAGNSFSHDFTIGGYGGAGGEGALSIGGGGKTASAVTLSAAARISANPAATFTFEGSFNGAGYDLNFSGSGRFNIGSVVGLDAASLTLSGTPSINFRNANASLLCGALSTSAGSMLELNTPNARVSSATIGGMLEGDQGTLVSFGTVVIANGGTIAGGGLSAPGFLTVDANLQLSNTATTYAYLKGNTGAASDGTGSQHGQLLITGSATIDGTLKLVRDASYTPAAGDEIYVMLRNAGSGSFAQVIVTDGSSAPATFSGAPGTAITIAGKTGVIQYNKHSSINLSSPDTSSDISIKF